MSTITTIPQYSQIKTVNYSKDNSFDNNVHQKKENKNSILKTTLTGGGAGIISGIFASMLIDSTDTSTKLLKKTWGGGAIAGLAVGLAKGLTEKFTNNDKAANIVGGIGYGATFGALSGIVLRKTFEIEKKITAQKAGKVGGLLGAGLGILISLSINTENKS